MKLSDLNDRQQLVLRFLAEHRPAMRSGVGWATDSGLYAFQVDDRLRAEGFIGVRRSSSRSYVPSGAANTLKALRKRGLVEFAAGPGCFVQATWRISEAGAQLVREAL